MRKVNKSKKKKNFELNKSIDLFKKKNKKKDETIEENNDVVPEFEDIYDCFSRLYIEGLGKKNLETL